MNEAEIIAKAQMQKRIEDLQRALDLTLAAISDLELMIGSLVERSSPLGIFLSSSVSGIRREVDSLRNQ